MRQLAVPALLFALITPVDRLLAQSITPAADGTGTIVTPNGNQLDITGGTRAGDNLFQSFQKFGLDPNQAANFIADPSLRNILGRVVGGDPSVIHGLIQVTGGSPNLYLMNPAGIIFGPSAILNVPADFTATTATGIGFGSDQFSTLGTDNYANLVGDPTSFAFSLSQPGALVNAGNLGVAEGQNLNLVGGTVVNTGTLSAPGGSITVMAVPGTSRVRLSQPGSLLSLEVDRDALAPTSNPAATLPALITGTGTEQATGLTIEPDGTVRLANVAISDTAGTNIVSGTINVSSPASPGGVVQILGDTVGLIAAKVQASGGTGGGTVLIGGDYKGQGSVPNAQLTVVDQNSSIFANANQTGDGGQVILWADGSTRFSGEILAQGGAISGNGGFVEVSGREFLTFRGQVNTLAPSGQPGMLLLDPTTLTIVASGGFFTSLDQVDEFADPDVSANTLDVNLINAATSNVFLQATDSITFDADVAISNPGIGLTAEAGNNITVNATISTNGGFIDLFTFNPGSDIFIASSAALQSNGGDIFLDSELIAIDGPVLSDAGDIVLIGDSITIRNTLDGTGLLVIEPLSLDTDIVLGGDSIGVDANGNPLVGILIDNTALALISSDFLGLVIGDSNGTGTIVLDASATFPVTVLLTGGSQLIGPNRPTTWYIDDFNAGELSGYPNGLFFEDIPNLQAGAFDDIFVFFDDGLISGEIDGGSGFDLLDYTNYSFPVQVNLANNQATGTGFVVNVEDFIVQGGSTIAPPPPEDSDNPNFLPDDDRQDLVGDLDQLNDPDFAGPGLDGGFQFDDFGNGEGPLLGSGLDGPGDIGPDGPSDPNSIGGPDGFDGPDGNSDGSTALGGPNGVDGPGDGPDDPDQPNNATGRDQPDAPGSDAPDDSDRDGDRPTAAPTTVVRVAANAVQDIPTSQVDVVNLDGGLSNAFTNYLGTGGDALPNPDDLKPVDTLQRIQRETGVISAFVYVNFVPAQSGEPASPQAEKTQVETEASVKAIADRETLAQLLVPTQNQETRSDTDELEILLVTGDGKFIRRRLRGVTRKQVMQMAINLRRTVTDPLTDEYLQPAQQLHAWLIAPIAEDLQLQEINHLTFLMPAGLRSLPIAALHDGQNFIIQNYSIGLMPSLALTDTTYTDLRGSQVLAMGASTFPQNSPLPAVPAELSLITQQLWQGRAFLNEAFTLENLKTQRRQGDYKIIHLATHGEFNGGQLSDSYIQLWDTRLSLDQIRTLDWNDPPVDLLVLSACRTALGNEEAELGFAGLAFKAGVRTAMGSLWYVSDEGTLAFMTEFYDQLREVPVKAEALRLAQLAMANGKIVLAGGELRRSRGAIALPAELSNLQVANLSHPYYWAAFTMIGNPW